MPMPGMDGLHEGIEIAAEGERLAQRVVVLRILAVVIGKRQKRKAVVIEREHSSHARQIIDAEMSQHDAQFGYFQFFVVERLLLQNMHRHAHLLMRSALDVMAFVTSALGGIVAMMMLRPCRNSRQRQDENKKEFFHNTQIFAQRYK